jgi:hypothetical protein
VSGCGGAGNNEKFNPQKNASYTEAVAYEKLGPSEINK